MGRRFEAEREKRRLSRPWFWHEDKGVRRKTNRDARHEAKVQLRRAGADAVLPTAPRTEGWETW